MPSSLDSAAFAPVSVSFSGGRFRRLFGVCWLGAALLAGASVPALGASRSVKVEAPATVTAGGTVNVSVSASTEAGGGEQIGFFHAGFSTDGGKTWSGFCFEEDVGAAISRTVSFPAGPAGSKSLVRVRVAFRGGKAGDVDFAGKPIDWDGSWNKWQSPPVKTSTTNVVAP